MKKYILTACLLAMFSAVAVAQDYEEEEPKKGFDKKANCSSVVILV